MSNNDEYESVKAVLSQHGQIHLLHHFSKLASETAKHAFVQQIQQLNFAQLPALLDSALQFEQASKALSSSSSSSSSSIVPFPHVVKKSAATAAQQTEWNSLGLHAIQKGEVAVVLLAGGQGTRLGSSAPKGCYDIGLPSHRSLFQIQAERILRLRQLAAQIQSHSSSASSSSSSSLSSAASASISLPWFIMTSIATHDSTVKFFHSNNFFGLPATQVYFFQQRELPAFDLSLASQGKVHVLCDDLGKLSLAPNGNGGIFDALVHSQSLSTMHKLGVKWVHVYGVDNVLIRVADPSLIGFAINKNAEIVNKVVLKTDPKEKVGVMCVRDGKAFVLEYSEIPEQLSAQRVDENDAKSDLKFHAANICNHLFSVSLLEQLASSPLPYHIARKSIPAFSETSWSVAAAPKSAPNALKLELFIFDIFSYASADKIFGFAVDRQEEFAAVKNANGKAVADSPHTAVMALDALYRKWLENEGVKVIEREDNMKASADEKDAGVGLNAESLVEISPLVSYAGEGLQAIAKTWKDSGKHQHGIQTPIRVEVNNVIP